MKTSYPFSAIVGQDQLKTALLLCAINPAIGGILIRGDKGTAKSTAARALAEVIPSIDVVSGCIFNCFPDAPYDHCHNCNQANRQMRKRPIPFINLPLGATEDRVLGSLDFEQALKSGTKAFQAGLLAHAHRGILYIDEVNLLADHLVDVLLDAAAMGVNSIQREGLSIEHPARISLIGSMNPEEGDLRPQLLDRFGMMVEVAAPAEVSVRAEVVRRRTSFESDSESFCRRWQPQQNNIRNQIAQAQQLLPQTVLDDGKLLFISSLCCEFNVTSLRADIVLHKACRAIAALDGRKEVTLEDIRDAAELVLPHRRRRMPSEQPGLDKDRLNDFVRNASSTTTPGKDGSTQDNGETHSQSAPQDFVFGAAAEVNKVQIRLKSKTTKNVSGLRTVSSRTGRGQYVSAVAKEDPECLAVDATIRHSVIRNNGRLDVNRADFHEKVRVGKNGSMILFIVDASGSMAALKRMESVKGAVISLLTDAYQRRDKIAVISFRGQQSELLLPPTKSIEMAELKLRELPTGGRTPLPDALQKATLLLRQTLKKDSPEPLLVILSDGKANVPLSGSGDPWRQCIELANAIAEMGVPSLVLDTESGLLKIGRARDLASALQGEYIELDNLTSESLALTIRRRLSKWRS